MAVRDDRKTVLVVDDEPHILKLVAFALSKSGYAVLEAADAITGMELARRHGPDLVLMDVMMPVVSGLEAVQRLKEDPATANIPVVMLSARSQRCEQEAGMATGALRYICKPFTPKELVREVSEIVGGG